MKKNLIPLFFLFFCYHCQPLLGSGHEIDLSIDYNGNIGKGHPCARPSVSCNDDEITIKADSTLYNVGIIIRDQYGNIMHQSVQTVSQEETVIYVPDDNNDSEKATIDLYYDEKHLYGILF